jgi:hypothetical protein
MLMIFGKWQRLPTGSGRGILDAGCRAASQGGQSKRFDLRARAIVAKRFD